MSGRSAGERAARIADEAGRAPFSTPNGVQNYQEAIFDPNRGWGVGCRVFPPAELVATYQPGATVEGCSRPRGHDSFVTPHRSRATWRSGEVADLEWSA